MLLLFLFYGAGRVFVACLVSLAGMEDYSRVRSALSSDTGAVTTATVALINTVRKMLQPGGDERGSLRERDVEQGRLERKIGDA